MAINLKPLFPYLADPFYCRTLWELSEVRQGGFCLSAESVAANFMAFNLDGIKADLCLQHGYPRGGLSADALLIQGTDVFLIEFKTSSIGEAEWFRKIYDSIILLVELGVMTWDDCRSNLKFVLVQRFAEASMRGNYSSDPNRDARFMEGCILSEVHRLPPERFDQFVADRAWHRHQQISTHVAVTMYPQSVGAEPPRNTIYPARWSEPCELPLELSPNDVTEFLDFRARRFIKANSGRDVAFEQIDQVRQSSTETVVSMNCLNPLDPTCEWSVTSWMRKCALYI